MHKVTTKRIIVEDNNDSSENSQNRDQCGCNKANAAVQGCIFWEMNKECIDLLIKNSDTSDSTTQLNCEQVVNILNIAKDSNNESKKLFIRSQNSISEHVCCQYASTQFSQVHNMNTNMEKLENAQSISTSIVNKRILNMTKELVAMKDQSGKY